MKKVTLFPSRLNGILKLPPSKSQTLRALLFATMASGKSVVHHYLRSPDTIAMIEACRSFGAKIQVHPEHVEIVGIDGKITCAEDVIQAGNSGIVARFCTAIGALGSHPVVITGDYSIRHLRPMGPLLEGLKQLHVSVSSVRGDFSPPVIVQGPFLGGKAVLEGADSQPVSALLIAAAFAKNPTTLFIKNAGEKPWVDLTLDWLERLGIEYSRNGYEEYEVKGNSLYSGFSYLVPGDLSSAAFPLAAALITNSRLEIQNFDLQEKQGDKKILSILENMGAYIQLDEKRRSLTIEKTRDLQGISIDVNDCIDALPILSVLGCFCQGTTHLYNGAIARKKESDRIQSIAQELKKMGAHLEEIEDGLKIFSSSLVGTTVDSHNDHRIALSLAVAALGAVGPTTIHNFDCVEKTFPHFLQEFQSLGALCKEEVCI